MIISVLQRPHSHFCFNKNNNHHAHEGTGCNMGSLVV